MNETFCCRSNVFFPTNFPKTKLNWWKKSKFYRLPFQNECVCVLVCVRSFFNWHIKIFNRWWISKGKHVVKNVHRLNVFSSSEPNFNDSKYYTHWDLIFLLPIFIHFHLLSTKVHFLAWPLIFIAVFSPSIINLPSQNGTAKISPNWAKVQSTMIESDFVGC